MPDKLPRQRNSGGLHPATPYAVPPIDPRTALVLGGAHIAHGVIQSSAQVASSAITATDSVLNTAIQSSAQVASSAITATGRVLESSIQSFGICFTAFMGYMREREITYRVITQEREITARVIAQEREMTARVVAQEESETERVRLWSATVIAEAEIRSEEVRTQAMLVLATIEDKRSQRVAKFEVIHGFMTAYQEWNSMLTKALANRADRMPLDERELLQRHIDTLLERAREMERNITTIAVTL